MTKKIIGPMLFLELEKGEATLFYRVDGDPIKKRIDFSFDTTGNDVTAKIEKHVEIPTSVTLVEDKDAGP